MSLILDEQPWSEVEMEWTPLQEPITPTRANHQQPPNIPPTAPELTATEETPVFAEEDLIIWTESRHNPPASHPVSLQEGEGSDMDRIRTHGHYPITSGNNCHCRN